MNDLPEDTRIIVVRRGELMRIAYPFTQYALDTTSPPELALSAAMMFLQLQDEYPGRADVPITSKTPQMALVLPGKDEPLDDDQPLWTVLAGHWQPYEVEVVGVVAEEFQRFPALALNLVDLHVFHSNRRHDGNEG